MTFTDPHRDHLLAHAVDLDVAAEAGCYSATSRDELPDELACWHWTLPGLVFGATGPDGRTTYQLRPDTPVKLDGDDTPAKYLFAKGATPVLAIHPRHRSLLDDGAATVLVVEGTKQTLAAVSCAPDGVLVVGIAGCYGWSSGGVPLPEWEHIPLDEADVVVAFDADVASNRQVHDAASKLAGHLEALGAAKVRFLDVPAGAKAGLDDYLATIPVARRALVLDQLVTKARKLPKRPPAAKKSTTAFDDPASAFFDKGGLRADALLTAVRDRGHYALGPDGSVWIYRGGIYQDDEDALVRVTAELLGDRWREMHHRNVMKLLAASLAAEERRLPESPINGLVATPNGLLDVATGRLHEHDPERLNYASLTVPWEPNATCPTFDSWLTERVGSQADDLLEAVGLMLVPHVGQRKVPFLIGPSRSGKGTFLRILEALVDPRHRSSVTLHDLDRNRFAAAALHGKILNVAGDLSDWHIEDLSVFKMLTGNDTIAGERKFRDRFSFRNSALFVFSANTAPTVSETSRAYLARMRPYVFPRSFEGHEDQAVEDDMLNELPGILVRLVEGAQRWLRRGGYAPANPIVADYFARSSDAVAMFVAQVLTPVSGSFITTKDTYAAYVAWCGSNGRRPLGRNRFIARADSHLGARRREHSDNTGARGWADWGLLDEESWGDEAGYDALIDAVTATSATFSPTSAHERCVKTGGSIDSVPREAKVGPELAEVAVEREPHDDVLAPPSDVDPDSWTEVEF